MTARRSPSTSASVRASAASSAAARASPEATAAAAGLPVASTTGGSWPGGTDSRPNSRARPLTAFSTRAAPAAAWVPLTALVTAPGRIVAS